MPVFEDVVLSHPMPIVWGGWESNTARLQQDGWELSLERDFRYMSMRIAMRHKNLQMYAITAPIRDDFIRRIESRSLSATALPTAHVQYMAAKMMINVPTDMSRFEPIDAMPQIGKIEVKDIEDFNIFATPLVRTEEIIVEPETVNEMLEKIKLMQLPEQEQIRQRNRFRELRAEGMRIDAMPRQKFHAQILSFR